jgi:hypothetical protein
MTNQRNEDPPVELSSPACSMSEADDVYMGYAGKAELLALLNELLEAERAGARVALESARAVPEGPIRALLDVVHHDEGRWCAMLLGHIKARGETPSSKMGAFYEKAMAIAELGERLKFLNRGQGWVVRKLREILPRVRDDGLHADLAEMLRLHETNIARTNEVAGLRPGV